MRHTFSRDSSGLGRNIDGQIGHQTNGALTSIGIPDVSRVEQIPGLDMLLQQKFPDEFFDKVSEEVGHLV